MTIYLDRPPGIIVAGDRLGYHTSAVVTRADVRYSAAEGSEAACDWLAGLGINPEDHDDETFRVFADAAIDAN